MKLNYVNKIEANLKNYKRIYTRKVTSNIMDGSYKSVYKGRSMNFDEIRDYVVGDDIKDVDWKASARSRKLLVRQYIAEKKHNIMLVMDTNKRMTADTDTDKHKADMAIMAAGTLAYLVNQNGDYIASAYSGRRIETTPFRTGLTNIESILQSYNHEMKTGNQSNLNDVLDYISKHFRQRMIIVIVTDVEGIGELEEACLKRLLILHDILLINVNSARLDGKKTYSIHKEGYLPDFFSRDKRLMKMQEENRRRLEEEGSRKLSKFGISKADITDYEDLDDCILKLLCR